jgi:hypothetical protein
MFLEHCYIMMSYTINNIVIMNSYVDGTGAQVERQWFPGEPHVHSRYDEFAGCVHCEEQGGAFPVVGDASSQCTRWSYCAESIPVWQETQVLWKESSGECTDTLDVFHSICSCNPV